MVTDSIIIIGGGLAGLTAAIHLQNNGLSVVLIEKNEYPKHKVCGEYISNEVMPYLNTLGLDISPLNPKYIDKLEFSLVSGKSITTALPLGGFGISRYKLDHYLYNQAIARGCIILQESVEEVNFSNDTFTVSTNLNTYSSKLVLGAFGKRSNIDVKLKRNFIQKQSNWLGVKAHYQVEFPDDLVGLHHFKGGYCGVSKVENDLVNICYLANYETFKQYKSIADYEQNIVTENPNLNEIFSKAKLQFEKPLSISQISFEEKKCVENHILMIGDTAGLIHPLCGNGMAMAIHSAKIAADLVIAFRSGHITNRALFEKKYEQQWRYNFDKRLKIGRLLSRILQKEKLAAAVMRILIIFPFLLPIIIKKTHGRPIL